MAEQSFTNGRADGTERKAAAFATDATDQDGPYAEPTRLPKATLRPTPGAAPPVRPSPGALDW